MGQELDNTGKQKSEFRFSRLSLEEALQQVPAYNLGQVYTARFEEALSVLIAEGGITGFQSTIQNSTDDSRGIDYWVEAEGKTIPFQVKANKQRGGGTHGKTGRMGARGTKYYREHGIAVVKVRQRQELKFRSIRVIKEDIMGKILERL